MVSKTGESEPRKYSESISRNWDPSFGKPVFSRYGMILCHPVPDFEFERRMSDDDAVDLDEAIRRLRGRMCEERCEGGDREELSEFHVNGLLQVLSEYECKGYS